MATTSPYKRCVLNPVSWDDWQEILNSFVEEQETRFTLKGNHAKRAEQKSNAKKSSKHKEKIKSASLTQLPERESKALRSLSNIGGLSRFNKDTGIMPEWLHSTNISLMLHKINLFLRQISIDGFCKHWSHLSDEDNRPCFVKLRPTLQKTKEWIVYANRDNGYDYDGTPKPMDENDYALFWNCDTDNHNANVIHVDDKDMKRGSAISTERTADIAILHALTDHVLANNIEKKIRSAAGNSENECIIRSIVRMDLSSGKLDHDNAMLVMNARMVVFMITSTNELPFLLGNASSIESDRIIIMTNLTKDLIEPWLRYHSISSDHVIQLDKNADIGKHFLQKYSKTLEASANDSYRRAWMAARYNMTNITEDTKSIELATRALLQPLNSRLLNYRNGIIAAINNPHTEFASIASVVYRGAKRIYATNTDKYNSFWGQMDAETKQSFMALCPTLRICIYKDRLSMIDDVSSLEMMLNHYADVNSAYIAVASYSYLRQSNVRNDCDVSFIEMNDAIVTGERTWCKFTLNDHDFEARLMTKLEVESDSMYQLLNLAYKTFNSKNDYHDSDNRTAVLWTKNDTMDKNKKRHEDTLKKMESAFKEKPAPACFRKILFKNSNAYEYSLPPEVFQMILDQIRQLYEGHREALAEIGLVSAHFGSCMTFNSHALSSKPGEEPTPDYNNSTLLLHFKDRDSLRSYASSPVLKKIRREVNKYFHEKLIHQNSEYAALHRDRGIPDDWLDYASIGRIYLDTQDYCDMGDSSRIVKRSHHG
jgi:hypothetical protein